jgi:hypothetical protein
VPWSTRGAAGVTMCANYSEGAYGHANQITSGRLSLPRRIAAVTRLIMRKIEQWSVEWLNRPTKQALAELLEWSKMMRKRHTR